MGPAAAAAALKPLAAALWSSKALLVAAAVLSANAVGLTREAVTVGLAFLTIFIASGAGVGGGGILVPLYVLVLGAERDAVPLSNATIFGASIVNVILYGRERHPRAARPLVDWDLILAMEPMTILGALIGSYINKIAPTWLTSIALTIVLSLTTYRMVTKGRKVYAREDATRKAAAVSYGSFSAAFKRDEDLGAWKEEKNSFDQPPALSRRASSLSLSDVTTFAADQTLDDILDEDDIHELTGPENVPGHITSSSGNAEVNRILQSEARSFPLEKIGGILVIFVAVIAVTILKGGRNGSPVGITCGSLDYWLLTAAIIPVTVGASLIVRARLIALYDVKKRIGYTYLKGDVQWGPLETIMYPSICAVAGLFAGMFGIGGGIVKGPLMVEMGVLPEIAVATSSTMIFFTTGAATVSFIVFGSLPMARGIAFFGVGLVAGFGGQFVMRRIVKSLDRPSYLIFGIATILGCSAVMMTTASIHSIMKGSTVHGVC